MTPIKRLSLEIARLKEYGELSEVGDIVRRYFAMNAFDGVLTILGVLIGAYVAGVQEPDVIVTTGLSTAAAMGVSGLWGAALTETAERKKSLDELEEATLSDLGDTKIGKASKLAVVVVSLADALAPLVSGVLVLVPFILGSLLPDIMIAYYASLAIGLATLFSLGMFLGWVSKDNLFVTGLKTVSAGLVSMAIGFILSPGTV